MAPRVSHGFSCREARETSGCREPDQAFLGGLLHDIGKMVLLHGDPAGFKKMVQQTEGSGQTVNAMGKKTCTVLTIPLSGVVLLDCWDFDAEVGKGLLHHHDGAAVTLEPGCGALLQTADYLAEPRWVWLYFSTATACCRGIEALGL